jgi:hypothetical protein
MNKITSKISQMPGKFELDNATKNKLSDFIIDFYVSEYKHLYKYPKDGNLQEGIDWLHNDLLQFIGIKWDLIKNNDMDGLKNWETLNALLIKNKYPDKERIREFLLNLSNKDFHAFLGHTTKLKILESPTVFLENK